MKHSNLVGFALAASLMAITMSDTVAGFCARAALVMPLVWSGLLDIETATSFAIGEAVS